jgi:pyrimidine operon attenuation protein/uracil phosphoribosyltransferase
MSSTEILNAEEIQFKIQRLAWELYDRHSRAQTLYVIGIKDNGYWLADQLVTRLREISEIDVTLLELVMDKENPVLENMHIDLPEGAELALVDDVLNSGRTLLWAVIKLMGFSPSVLSTTVLVDRSHKRYPVKADIKGVSLSTTLQETVQLNVVGGKAVNVYLA